MSMQMDRTASNPLFGARGAAPIPEEYQNKKPAAPRPPPAPPAAPPPQDDAAIHEEFERLRQEAAKKRELAGRPLSFRYFLPRMGSSHRDHQVEGLEREPSGGQMAEHKPKRTSILGFGHRISPHPPHVPPPADIPETDYAEWDRLHTLAAEQKKRLPKPPSKFNFDDVTDEMHREFDRLKHLAVVRRGMNVVGRGTSLLSMNPPPLEPTKGYDDGEPVKGAKYQPELKFKSYRERCVYEIRHRHAIERALMAGLAVCLLWLTSLAVARAIVSAAIYGPALKTVMNLGQVAIDVTDDEKKGYAACAKRLEGECNRTFDAQLLAEVDRVNGVINKNRYLLGNITAQRNNCSDRLGDVILVLDFMVNNLSYPLEPKFTKVANLSATPVCSAVLKTLQDQIAAIRAQQKAEEFQAIADAQVLSVQQQFRARAAYDQAYLGNSTQVLLGGGVNLADSITDPDAFFGNMSIARNKMLACGTATGVYQSQQCGNTTLLQQVSDYRDRVLQTYTSNKQRMEDQVKAAQEKYAPLIAFYNNFRSALSRVAGLKAALDGTANDNGGGGSGLAAFGFQDIDADIGSVALPSTTSFSTYMGSNAGPFATADQNNNNLVNNDAAAKADMDGATDAQKAKQTSWQSTYFSDYNPPPYDIDAQTDQWTKTSSAYLPDVQQDLSVVARRVAPAKQDEFEPTPNSSDSGRTARDIIQDTELTPFTVYTYDDIDPIETISVWDTITRIALAMDYVYRILRSIVIIRSYISVSAVIAPPADVRVLGNGVTKGVAQKQRLTPDQVMANLITHPAVNLLLALIFLGVVSAAFLAVYLPFFNGYHEGCIVQNSDLVVNGTQIYTSGDGYKQEGSMITNFVRTLAEEAAYSDGDSISANAIDRMNLQRELQCSKNEDLSFKQLKVQRQELDFNVEKMDSVNNTVQSFRACINAAAIDANLTTNQIKLATDFLSSSVVQSLYTTSCDTPFLALNTSTFNCNAIRNCTLTCAGVNQEGIYKVTYDAGCTGEQYLHASILGTAFSFLAFILMNLSRWTFMRGIRRVLMDHFAIGEYSYLATTNEHGDTEFPEKVMEGVPFKEFIRDELHETIKRYKRSGLLICFIAVCINLPWVIGLSEFSKALQFQLASQNSIGAVPV